MTSRGDTRAQYALIRHSDSPLQPSDHGVLHWGELVNLQSGNPLGASQVTSVVRRRTPLAAPGAAYPVALRARLVAPYFLRLADPAVIGAER